VGGVVRGCHAEQHTLGVGIVVRGALAVEIGQEDRRLGLLRRAQVFGAGHQFGHLATDHAG
jgi:hypothetical protein